MFTFEQRKDGTYSFQLPNDDSGLQPPQYSISDGKKGPLETVTPVFDRDNKFPSSDFHLNRLSSLLDKLLIIASTIIPLTISSILLGATLLNLHSTGLILDFISSSRATAQILVSMLSATLSTLNIYTLTKLLNLSTRLHLLHHHLSLNHLKFLTALQNNRFTTSLPPTLSLTSLLLVLLFALPNTIWTGALTPIITNATITSTNALKIPQFVSSSVNKTWAFNPELTYAHCNTTTNAHGTFSNCPVDILQSSLLTAASQASSALAPARAKTDNSQYTYSTRSYGVGSPIGLLSPISPLHSDANLLTYKYSEPGYLTTSSCFKNTSSNWHLKEIQAGKGKNGIPAVYYALGHFPNNGNNHTDFFSMIGMQGSSSIVAVSAKRYADRTVLLITAGSDYVVLNQTQCEISFTPTNFDVYVDAIEKLISVQPRSKGSFDETGKIAGNVIDEMNSMGMMSNSLYSSDIGNALVSNFIASNISSTTPSPELYAALDDSLAVIMDGLLLFISSSQYFDPNANAEDFFNVDAQLVVQAVKLGQAEVVVVVFVMCVLILLVVVFEGCRTMAWRGLPRWDFADTTSLILASAVAGDDILEAVLRDEEGSLTGIRQTMAVGKMRLRLERKVLGMAGYGYGRNVDAVSFWTSHTRDAVPLDVIRPRQ